MANRLPNRVPLLLTFLLLAMACDSAPEKLNRASSSASSKDSKGYGSDKNQSDDLSEDLGKPVENNGGGEDEGKDEVTETPVGGEENPPAEIPVPPKPIIVSTPLSMQLDSTPNVDAYDYTFGVTRVKFGTEIKDGKIAFTRYAHIKANTTLTLEENAFVERYCRDIGLSESAEAMAEASVGGKDRETYLMWRSHFAPDLRLFLVNYLAKHGESLKCALKITLEKDDKREEGFLLFDALSAAPEDVSGTMKVAQAQKEGLVLPLYASAEKMEAARLFPIKDQAAILFKTPALKSEDATLEAQALGSNEQCYLIASGGSSALYNPNSQTSQNYSLKAKSPFIQGLPKTKALNGREIKECSNIDVISKSGEVSIKLTCGEYFAVKDQGMEAGCAWALPFANKDDPENAHELTVLLEKFTLKTRDGSFIQEQKSLSTIPISGINDVRDGKVKMNLLSKGQRQLIEDAIDLWIAIDETSYRTSFYNHINEIAWDGGCNYGAYARFGDDMFTWCAGGALTESYSSRRFADPNLLLYRAILAWHETRHTQNFAHDRENRSYKPCEGTAKTAYLSLATVRNCNFDYCKSVRPTAVSNFKAELNYDYDGDTTGRKSQGDCKLWSRELGVTGEGF